MAMAASPLAQTVPYRTLYRPVTTDPLCSASRSAFGLALHLCIIIIVPIFIRDWLFCCLNNYFYLYLYYCLLFLFTFLSFSNVKLTK